MFILSSNSFLQAYKRIQYMKQYAGYRKMQAEEIKQVQQGMMPDGMQPAEGQVQPAAQQAPLAGKTLSQVTG